MMSSPEVQAACYEIWLFGPGGFAQQVDECGSHWSFDRAAEVASALETWLHTSVYTPPLRALSPRRKVQRSLLLLPHDLRQRGTAAVDPADVDVCVIAQAKNVLSVRAPLGSRYHAGDDDEDGEDTSLAPVVLTYEVGGEQ